MIVKSNSLVFNSRYATNYGTGYNQDFRSPDCTYVSHLYQDKASENRACEDNRYTIAQVAEKKKRASGGTKRGQLRRRRLRPSIARAPLSPDLSLNARVGKRLCHFGFGTL